MAQKNEWRELGTLGEIGSEKGVIIADWEASDGARVTVEEGCRGIPFSITMGIYGCGLHTMFYGDREVSLSKACSLMAEIDGLFQQFDEDPDFDVTGWFYSIMDRY